MRDTASPALEWPIAGRLLGRLVDAVARIKASVHAKLLAGFLVGAFLILVMGLLNLLILGHMADRVTELTRLQEKVDWARRMEYQVTAQSHYRAMALLTRDDSNNDKIATAKATFQDGLDAVQRLSRPEQLGFYDRVREANDRFATSSARALALYQAGDISEALRVHLSEEHPISHELEDQMRQLESLSVGEMGDAFAAYQSDRGLLTMTVLVFGAVGVLAALLLGFALSWAFIRPVRKIDEALAGIAAGDFGRQVEVPNRDEFGTLTQNLNTSSRQLATMYSELRSLNENLQNRVQEQVLELDEQRLQQEIAHHELARAWEIQSQLLPKELTGWPGRLEIAARFRPARETSGDFYDVLELAPASDSRPPLQIAVGDVAGKGIGAALVMALARTTLRAAALQSVDTVEHAARSAVSSYVATASNGGGVATASGTSPSLTLRFASDLLNRDLGPQDFVACALATLESRADGNGGTGIRLRLANAGQVPPLHCRGGRVVELAPPGERLPLGVEPGLLYEELGIDLEPGDVVVFASDGLPEAPAQQTRAGDGAVAAGEFFSFGRLAASAARWSEQGRDAEAVAAGIWADVTAWAGEDAYHDDMTLLVLRAR